VFIHKRTLGEDHLYCASYVVETRSSVIPQITGHLFTILIQMCSPLVRVASTVLAKEEAISDL